MLRYRLFQDGDVQHIPQHYVDFHFHYNPDSLEKQYSQQDNH